MRDKTVFSYPDYKSFIREKIEENPNKWGLISKLAKAAGCQRSYFSRVLNSEINLTPDHAYGLAELWRFPDAEVEFFLQLLERDRAATSSYRRSIERKLAQLKKSHEELLKRTGRPEAKLKAEDFVYFSAWYYSAIHFAVSIPKYQTIKALATRFHLEPWLVENVLKILQTQGLIENENGKWLFKSGNFHSDRLSPLLNLYHAHWRDRAILNAQKLDSNNIHYTVVQSIDEKAWETIKAKILKLIEEASAVANPSKEERLICFACDFFEV